jgi:cation:H+ antiporter
LIAGAPVLPSADTLNSWLASLGVALTVVYALGVIARPRRCRARLGPDSILALALFALGIAGLFALPH